MKYFGCDKGYNYIEEATIYELYYIPTGVVFYKLTLSDGSDATCKQESIIVYQEIQSELGDICISIKDFDEHLSYDKYILPLLRDIKLNQLGI